MSDVNRLKSWAAQNEAATAVLKYLRTRERSREITDLYQLKQQMTAAGVELTDAEYYPVWEKLMALNIGTFVQARASKHAQFRWKYAARSVAEAALGQGKLTTIQRMRTRRERPEQRDPRKKRVFRVPFPLTEAEARRYANMILDLVG